MNELSVLIQFVIDYFNSQELVNTITLQSDYDLDTQKENIYQLVNIDLKEVETQEAQIICYFDISCYQQRNTDPKKTDSKQEFDTNLIDNLNETHSTLNKFILYLTRKSNEHFIELESYTRLVPAKNKFINNLDGFKFNAAISIPNKTSAC